MDSSSTSLALVLTIRPNFLNDPFSATRIRSRLHHGEPCASKCKHDLIQDASISEKVTIVAEKKDARTNTVADTRDFLAFIQAVCVLLIECDEDIDQTAVLWHISNAARLAKQDLDVLD